MLHKAKEVLVLLAMFWNVENYFDPFNNPDKDDDSFTPTGEKFWSWKKFEKKRDDLAKTIFLVKEEQGIFPAVIGLCEVESYYVLKQLVEQTPLARERYKILHKESPDNRGIDVAMLYKSDDFELISNDFFETDIPNTRLILYAKGVVNELDTLHLFVTHFPSKLGGAKKSNYKRECVANFLNQKTDSILSSTPKANIILMGDFNDTQQAKTLQPLSRFTNMSNNLPPNKLIKGTLKYKQNWEQIDHFFISPSMSPQKISNTKEGQSNNVDKEFQQQWLYCKEESMKNFTNPFLLEQDKVYLGVKLKRTYSGPRYLGGISDHLPIILRIYGVEIE